MLTYDEFLLPADSPIHCVWALRGSSQHEPQRVVPDGRMEIIYHLAEPFLQLGKGPAQRQPVEIVAGQITRPLLVQPTGQSHTVGVRLQSWAAALVAPLGGRSLTNSLLEGAALDQRWLRSLRACVQRHTLHLPTLAACLLRLFEGRTNLAEARMRAAVEYAERVQGVCAVDDLARAAEVGPRQLERLFDRHVGVGPKTFLRIRRFSNVFGQLSREENWAHVAASCGYTDQSHLTKDFRQFAGIPPKALLAQGADLAVHFTGLDDGFLQDPRRPSL